MAKYELSIKASYLSNWGIYEGVRELIQNARDAEVQFNAPMTVKYAPRKRNGKNTGGIIILNEGTVLPKEALLIGHTTKEGDSRLIGKFGEGLKFGVLALLRRGMEIKIRNGSEVWIPEITHSEKFNAEVLVFNVTSGHKEENRVQFEVIGVDEEDWKDISAKLLFIGEYPERVEVAGGSILTSPDHKGKIFVKGMFVANTGSKFGYDFKDADIDRDRRMVSDLPDKTSSLLAQAVNRGHLKEAVYRLMMEGADEASYISSYRLDNDGRNAITKAFQAENPGVIPVERSDQVKELESYGKRGQQVPWGIRGILESTMGTAGQHLVDLRKSDKVQYAFAELNENERLNLVFAVSTVARACEKLGDVVVGMDKVFIVDFNKPDLLGTYDPNTGNIRIARKLLKSKGKTLYTLVHEVAHTHGGDGIRSHEESIGAIMETILDGIL